jgi:hypothetical protein
VRLPVQVGVVMLDLDTADVLAPARADAAPSMTPGDLLELFGSGAVVLLLVSAHGVDVRLDGSLRRFVAECEDIVIGRMSASELDPAALWFRLFAAPRLRRVGMPVDRVVPGYYLFRYDLLLGFCPPGQPAGKLFAELAGID